MNEERIARILLELRRIGVDLSTLDEGLVGTGLRASELAEWLRAIPDGAGVEELQRRLDERSRESRPPVEYRWKKEPAHSPTLERRERWWPTQALLDAGTDLLEEEWDPFGIRLAGADREQIAMFAFHFFGPLLEPNDMVDQITHTTEMIASAERDHLALRPSPEPHRRYLARRLRELVERHPVPPRPYRPSKSFVVMTDPAEGTPPPLDPEGVCGRCHSFGTVARVTTQSDPPRSVRYCRVCWPEVRIEYGLIGKRPKPPETASEWVAWNDAIDRPPRSSESRSWLETMDFIRLMTEEGLADAGEDPTRAHTLARLAADIMAMDNRMDGPMPPEVEAFVQQHRAPDA